MDSSNSSKSYRVRDFLPSIRPSFLSLMLVFACGSLWMKNQTTNQRLIALEHRMNMFPLEDRVNSGSTEVHEPTTLKPTEESVELLLKKIQTPVSLNRIDQTSGLPIFTKVPPSIATPVQDSTFRAVCQAQGFPRPMLNWTRSAMPLPVGKTEVKDGTLTIKDLSLADNGFYDCVATNSMGTKKARINVVVQRKPGLALSVIIGNNRNYLTSLNNWLSPVVQSVNSNWKGCWRASVDGWAASTFHAKCDGKGPTVTIIRVGGKYIFGGYTSLSWGSSSEWYQYDSKAFVFSLVNKPGWAPVKLSQTGKYSYSRHSIYSQPLHGPTFGGGFDIHVTNQAASNSRSYTRLGETYGTPTGHSYDSTFTQTFLAGSYYFTPDEVETFFETT